MFGRLLIFKTSIVFVRKSENVRWGLGMVTNYGG